MKRADLQPSDAWVTSSSPGIDSGLNKVRPVRRRLGTKEVNEPTTLVVGGGCRSQNSGSQKRSTFGPDIPRMLEPMDQ
jgi:hypothetical protein